MRDQAIDAQGRLATIGSTHESGTTRQSEPSSTNARVGQAAARRRGEELKACIGESADAVQDGSRRGIGTAEIRRQDPAKLEREYVKVYSVKRAFGIDAASVWKRK